MNIAILLLAGSGSRADISLPKQYAISNKGVPLFIETFLKIKSTNLFDRFVFAIREKDEKKVDELIKKHVAEPFEYDLVKGGDNREESVYNSLLKIEKTIAKTPSIVLIHDADRPYITKELVKNAVESAKEHGSAIPVIKSVDSLVSKNENGVVYLKRENVYRVQTPQAFAGDKLLAAFNNVERSSLKDFTDDGSIFEMTFKGSLYIMEGDKKNVKITSKEDLSDWINNDEGN